MDANINAERVGATQHASAVVIENLLAMNSTLGVTLLVIAGSVFGVWLGQQLQTRREDRRWRQQKKLDAYLLLLARLNEYERGMARWRSVTAHTTREDLEAVATAVVNYEAARAGLQLVASHGVLEQSALLNDLIEEWFKARKAAAEAKTEMPRTPAMSNNIQGFVVAARADLGFRRWRLRLPAWVETRLAPHRL
jgi:hypothetical protein